MADQPAVSPDAVTGPGSAVGDELADILMVEDDPGDIAYTQDILADHRLRNQLTVLTDGLDAVRYLRQEPPHQHATLPDLILLDLHLPGLDGRTVLDIIRADRRLRDIAVVVLTTSTMEERLLRDFGVPAEHYLVKPVNLDRLVDLIRRVDTLGIRVDRVR